MSNPFSFPSIPADAFAAARTRLAGIARRTPLLAVSEHTDRPAIHVKLENLQPIGSFKLRGAANAIGSAPDAAIARGVVTASAGNMAQGAAWCARQRGVPCTVILPDTAPAAKREAITALGARIIAVPFAQWWATLEARRFDGVEGMFVHPFDDPAVMTGNGTIASELLEDFPTLDTVIVPYGGGGLACGIAMGLRAIGSAARVYAVEVETAAPLHAALEAGTPVTVARRASFVDGIGSTRVADAMWPLAQEYLAGSIVVSLDEIADAIRFLATRVHVIAEGAGATAVAAARRTLPGASVACIVSGGNIDSTILATILRGETPHLT